MLRYIQKSGETYLDNIFEGIGYSGSGPGRNNGALEGTPNIGPIPKGGYNIGVPRNSETLGPLVFDLNPVGHDAHGRTLFRIHGDNVTHTASHGCIILGRAIREYIAKSGVRHLEVI